MPTALIIDDEYAIRVYYERVLELLGFSVVSVKQGLEALQVCQGRTAPFDLAIIDWLMPVMNGSEIKKHLEQIYPGMPMIVASGSVDPSQVKLNEHQTFLMKPFSAEELIKALNTVMGAGFSLHHP